MNNSDATPTWAEEKLALQNEVAALKRTIEEMERLRNTHDASLPMASLVEVDDGSWTLLNPTAAPLSNVPSPPLSSDEPARHVVAVVDAAVEEAEEAEGTATAPPSDAAPSPPPLVDESAPLTVPSHVVAVVEAEEGEADMLRRIASSSRGYALVYSHLHAPLTTNDVTHTVSALPWGAGLVPFVAGLLGADEHPWLEIRRAPAPALAHDRYTLKSVHTGMYLCAEPSGHVVANRPAAREWEWFRAVPRGDGAGAYAFQSCHGTYLCVEPTGAVVCNRRVADAWETFCIVPV